MAPSAKSLRLETTARQVASSTIAGQAAGKSRCRSWSARRCGAGAACPASHHGPFPVPGGAMPRLVKLPRHAAQARSGHDRLAGLGDGGGLAGADRGAIRLEPEGSASALPTALLGGLAPGGADAFTLVLTLKP